MTIGSVRRRRLALPGVTEAIKRDDDLLSAGLTTKAQAAMDTTLARLRRGSS
jgi:hypothetical protein